MLGCGNQSRYRTCCCHVRTFALVIAVLEALSLLSTLIGAIQGNLTIGGLYYVSIVGFIGMLIAVPLMIFGVVKKKSLALIPHIVLQVLSIVGAVIGGIVYIVLGALVSTDESEEEKRDNAKWLKTTLIVAGVVFFAAAMIQIYFTYVIFRCFKYLKETYNASASQHQRCRFLPHARHRSLQLTAVPPMPSVWSSNGTFHADRHLAMRERFTVISLCSLNSSVGGSVRSEE